MNGDAGIDYRNADSARPMYGRPSCSARPEHTGRNRIPRNERRRSHRFDSSIRGDEGDIRVATKPFDLRRGKMRREALQRV